MDFGEILTKAWKTIWKHKILWLFGVLAGCGATSGMPVASNPGSPSGPEVQFNNGQQFFGPQFPRMMQDWVRTITEIPVWVWILAAVFLLVLGVFLSVVCLFLGSFGKAGVIAGTGLAAEASEDAKALSFGEVFAALKPYYWKILLLYVGLMVLGFVLGILLALPIVIFILCTCFLGLFLLIPLGWFVEMLVDFSAIAIIEEDLGIFKGIERAWQVITRNFGNVFLMFLILGVGQLIVGLIIALPLLTLPLPILISLFTTGFRTMTAGLIIAGILFMVFLPIVIFLSGVLRAYVLACWTLTYRRLAAETDFKPTVLNEEKESGEA